MLSNELKRLVLTSETKVRTIELTHDKVCFVDADLYEGLMHYKWRAVKSHRCYYAKTTVGKAANRCEISMHRLIAQTPRNMQCHHRDRNSLNNRRANLINMTRRNHESLHRNNNLKIKFARVVTPADFQKVLETL